MMAREGIDTYLEALHHAIQGVECTDVNRRPIDLGDAFGHVSREAHLAHRRGNKLMFVGNGGSAGIASHLAIDFSKNGGLRALAFNDSAMLTCLGNDLGYDAVFAKQVEWHARGGDLLVAISSSGRSANILGAVGAARALGCAVVTLSGFAEDNPLRQTGDVNFYVRSPRYGFVEVAHLALLHAILDLDMGWPANA